MEEMRLRRPLRLLALPTVLDMEIALICCSENCLTSTTRHGPNGHCFSA